jgi:hypothetical protein
MEGIVVGAMAAVACLVVVVLTAAAQVLEQLEGRLRSKCDLATTDSVAGCESDPSSTAESVQQT